MQRMGTACALALALIAGPAGAETDSTAAAPGAASTEAAVTAAKPAAAAMSPAPAATHASGAARTAGKAATMSGAAQVVVLETAQGTIVIRLRDDAAPRTC